MPFEHLARAGLKRYLGRQGGKVIKNLTWDDAVKGLQPKTRKVINLSQTTNNGELLPSQVRTMQDTFAKNTDEGLEFLEELEDGVIHENWNNLGAHLSDASRKADQDFQGAAIDNVKDMQLEPTQPAPRRTDNRAPIEQMLDDIYTEGMSPEDASTFRQSADFKGQYTQDKKTVVGNIAGSQRNILQMSPHHFGMDLELTGKVISPADSEVVRELNALDVWPGNHPNNFIGSYHDMSKRLTDAQKSQIIEATGKSPAEVDKFLKKIPEGSSLGKKELSGKNEWKVMDMIQSLKETKTRNWNEMTGGKLKLQDFELPEALIGVDHQDLIHGAINKLDSRKQLIALAKTPEWTKYTPKQKALAIAKVAREQQNIALNVSNWRLKKIEQAMKAEGIEIKDWTDIQTWMIQNPQKAAHLDWHKTAQVGSGMTGEQLSKDLPSKRAKLVAQVFNLEHVPNTSKLMKQAK